MIPMHLIYKTPSRMRPAYIYSALFTWNATTGGRFLAPMLKHSSGSLSDSSIGIILATQMLISSILGKYGGSIADRMEQKYGLYKGRTRALVMGVMLGTVAFLLSSIVRNASSDEDEHDGQDEGMKLSAKVFYWHLLLRCTYAVAVALTAPVLDGLTVSYLNQNHSGGSDLHDNRLYGRERLHGAIWWGIANFITGICVDRWGFQCLYFLGSLAALSVCVTVYIFVQVNANTSKYENEPLASRDAENYDTLESDNVAPISCNLNNEEYGKSSIGNVGIKDDVTKIDIFQLNSILIVFGSIHTICYFLAFFLLNSGMAVVENLVFLFYESLLGNSYTMCGLTVAFTVLLELPIFHLAPYLLSRYDPSFMLGVACLAFIIRSIGYSIVPKMGLFVLGLDLLHGVSYACSQTSGVSYIADLMPEGLEASGQGVLLLIRGLGAMLGLCMGGVMEQNFGGRLLYILLALISSVGLLLLIMSKLYFKAIHTDCNGKTSTTKT